MTLEMGSDEAIEEDKSSSKKECCLLFSIKRKKNQPEKRTSNLALFVWLTKITLTTFAWIWIPETSELYKV